MSNPKQLVYALSFDVDQISQGAPDFRLTVIDPRRSRNPANGEGFNVAHERRVGITNDGLKVEGIPGKMFENAEQICAWLKKGKNYKVFRPEVAAAAAAKAKAAAAAAASRAQPQRPMHSQQQQQQQQQPYQQQQQQRAMQPNHGFGNMQQGNMYNQQVRGEMRAREREGERERARARRFSYLPTTCAHLRFLLLCVYSPFISTAHRHRLRRDTGTLPLHIAGWVDRPLARRRRRRRLAVVGMAATVVACRHRRRVRQVFRRVCRRAHQLVGGRSLRIRWVVVVGVPRLSRRG